MRKESETVYQSQKHKTMKKNFILPFFTAILMLVLLPAGILASEITDKLEAIKSISQIKELKSSKFKEKYSIRFNHPVDYKDSTAERFDQQVVVCHTGFDRPTIIVTEGYSGAYALSESYTSELAEMLQANLIHVEYRYFGNSMPSPCRWEYLTVWNSLNDLHEIVTSLKTIYPEKWLATGVSKGGMTTIFYRAYFPNDVDVSVPYVAPFNKAQEDGRHEKFLNEEVGTKMERSCILNFQKELLKRKGELMPLFTGHCQKNNYKFNLPLDKIYDYCVLEFSFAFWQWGWKVHNLPDAANCPAQELFNTLISCSSPDYFQYETSNKSFFVQAARELGYYGYDVNPLKPYISLKDAENYLTEVLLPKELQDITFDNTLYKHTYKFLKKEDPKMLFLYGENDPWTASGVNTWLDFSKKKNMKLFMDPCGSHISRINTLPATQREEAIRIIKEWMK